MEENKQNDDSINVNRRKEIDDDAISSANPILLQIRNFAVAFLGLSAVHYFTVGDIRPFRTFVAATVATLFLAYNNRRKK